MQGGIANTERLAIFVLDSNRMKAGGVHWRAFLPGDDHERSFFRTDNLPADEIAAIGQKEVGDPNGRQIRGWAELAAQNVIDAPPLHAIPSEPPPRHGVIVDWPAEIHERNKLAMILADVAIKRAWPQTASPLSAA